MTLAEDSPDFDPSRHLLSAIHRPHAHALHTGLEGGARVHPLRDSLSLAWRWLARDGEEFHAEACRILEAVAALQKSDPSDGERFGVWPWILEESDGVKGGMDSNTSCFFGSVYALVLRHHAPCLDATALDASRLALQRAADGIAGRPFRPEYSNIALLGTATIAPAGELLGRPDLLQCARERLDLVEASVRRHGGFAEYNSPVYTPVAIEALERLLYGTRDPVLREGASRLLSTAWKTAAEHYHAPTKRWAGPFSRTYSDLPSMDFVHARCGLPNQGGAAPSWALPPPEPWISWFRKPLAGEAEIRRLFIAREPPLPNTYGTTWMDSEACLGSASSDNTTYQRRPLIGYWTQPGTEDPAVFRVRCLRDGHDFASCVLRCAQRGPRVLCAATFARNLGDVQHLADRPEEPVFPTTRLVLRLQVQGAGATAESDGNGGGTLRAGAHCIAFASPPSAPFGQPVRWEVRETGDEAYAEAVLFESDTPVPLDIRKASEPLWCGLAVQRAGDAGIPFDLVQTPTGAAWSGAGLSLDVLAVADYP